MANWIKVLPDGSDLPKLINADWYFQIEANAGDPDNKTDFKNTNGDIITIAVPLLTVQQFLRPLLIREDELGAAL